MLGIEPDLHASLYCGCGSSFSIHCFSLYCLALSHLHLEVLMDLLQWRLDLISIQASMIPLLGWFLCKRHPVVRSHDRNEAGTLC